MASSGIQEACHKTADRNIQEIASQNYSALVLECESVDFKKEDYPGYNNKRGVGLRCDN